MTRPIIEVRGIGKQYRLGQARGRYLSLRDEITGKFRRRDARESVKECKFWALRNVTFEVNPGEAVGLIGRNGAGKSTLLKVLSKITPPTEGKVIMRGRPGSLLEVGTGFHPELTGRENIYLNGSILGMSRKEIAGKFDDIVQFAEVEKFLDTPVKRYSSGMYVRLAFGVAAHLEPEILIVDEVLAVGDAQFQRKCLGKMSEIAHGGRTVIFVSHSMPAIEALCTRAVLLKAGSVCAVGAPRDLTRLYLAELESASQLDLAHRADREGDGSVRFTSLAAISGNEGADGLIVTGGTVIFRLGFVADRAISEPAFFLTIWDQLGIQIIHMNTKMTGFATGKVSGPGEIECMIRELPLPPGRYRVNIAVEAESGYADRVEGAMMLDVVEGLFFEGPDTSAYAHGKCLVKHSWYYGD
jgi:lipopolysaccharide transport system ATP-binding protein